MKSREVNTLLSRITGREKKKTAKYHNQPKRAAAAVTSGFLWKKSSERWRGEEVRKSIGKRHHRRGKSGGLYKLGMRSSGWEVRFASSSRVNRERRVCDTTNAWQPAEPVEWVSTLFGGGWEDFGFRVMRVIWNTECIESPVPVYSFTKKNWMVERWPMHFEMFRVSVFYHVDNIFCWGAFAS